MVPAILSVVIHYPIVHHLTLEHVYGLRRLEKLSREP